MKKIEDIIGKIEADGFAEDPASEIIKLEIGEYKELELMDIEPFQQGDKTRHRYTVKDLETDIEKTLFGTTQLDQILTKKEIGDQFVLLRIEDKPIAGRPKPMAQYRTFTKKE